LSPDSVGRVDHQRAAELVLDVGDHRLDLALAFLGRVIFRILRKVAMRARFLDGVDHLGPFGFQTRQLVVEHPVPHGQHRHLVDRRHQ
jgi:hypothetical protein